MEAVRGKELEGKSGHFPRLGESLLAFGKNRIARLYHNLHRFYAGRLGMVKVRPMQMRLLHRRKSFFNSANMPLALVYADYTDMASRLTREDKAVKSKRDLYQSGDIKKEEISIGIPVKGRKIDKPERFQSSDTSPLLPSSVIDIFTRYLHQGLPAARIHRSENIDRYLDSKSADAMTLGHDIYIRNDKYDLSDNRSLALLGHELTHVAQQTGARNSKTANGLNSSAIYEEAAQNNERFIYSRLRQPGQTINSVADTVNADAGATAAIPVQSNAGQASQPMYAESDRNIAALANITASAEATGLSEAEKNRLKDEVYRDLMMRMKLDLERGC